MNSDQIQALSVTEVEWFFASGADGRVLLVAGRTEQSVVAMSEGPVNQIRSTLGANETFLVPVFALETHILHIAICTQH